MEITHVAIIVAIFFALPFIVWAVFRFLDKIKHIWLFWFKWLIIGVFFLSYLIAIIIVVLFLVL